MGQFCLSWFWSTRWPGFKKKQKAIAVQSQWQHVNNRTVTNKTDSLMACCYTRHTIIVYYLCTLWFLLSTCICFSLLPIFTPSYMVFIFHKWWLDRICYNIFFPSYMVCIFHSVLVFTVFVIIFSLHHLWCVLVGAIFQQFHSILFPLAFEQ
jgi:hypothetical protein